MIRPQMYRDSNVNKSRLQGRPHEFKPTWMPTPPPAPPVCSAPIVGFPRSAFEAVHDDTMKFRQLPCRTHISVGVCPYREKCVFLHDPRCGSLTAKSITRLKNKNKDDCIADSLYWPAMPRSMVMQYPEHGDKRAKNPYHPYDDHDPEAQPHTAQPYCVPVPQQDQYHLHDAAVYSLWMHFVDFCLANNTPCSHADSAMCYAAVDVAVNPYTRSKRLPVFRTLCNGQHVPYPGSRPVAAASPAPPVMVPPPRDVRAPVRDPEYLGGAGRPAAGGAMEIGRLIAPPRAMAPIGAPAVAPSTPAMTALAAAGTPPAPSTGTSPMVLTRRNSAGSPVSVTEHLKPGASSDPGDYVVEDAGVEALLGDCGVSALRRENLPRQLVSPLMMPSLF